MSLIIYDTDKQTAGNRCFIPAWRLCDTDKQAVTLPLKNNNFKRRGIEYKDCVSTTIKP